MNLLTQVLENSSRIFRNFNFRSMSYMILLENSSIFSKFDFCGHELLVPYYWKTHPCLEFLIFGQ